MEFNMPVGQQHAFISQLQQENMPKQKRIISQSLQGGGEIYGALILTKKPETLFKK